MWVGRIRCTATQVCKTQIMLASECGSGTCLSCTDGREHLCTRVQKPAALAGSAVPDIFAHVEARFLEHVQCFEKPASTRQSSRSGADSDIFAAARKTAAQAGHKRTRGIGRVSPCFRSPMPVSLSQVPEQLSRCSTRELLLPMKLIKRRAWPNVCSQAASQEALASSSRTQRTETSDASANPVESRHGIICRSRIEL